MKLPGLEVKAVDVFNIHVGEAVYDKDSGKVGVISSVRETSYEVIEAFITLGGEKEVLAYTLPNAVFITE